MVIHLIYVALGGALGAMLRYLTVLGFGRLAGGFPWGTMAANIAGSLAMGLLIGWLMRRGGSGEALRLFVGVGLLGGFTTFSAFSLDVVLLWQRGDVAGALGYGLASVLVSILALLAGLAVMRGAI